MPLKKGSRKVLLGAGFTLVALGFVTTGWLPTHSIQRLLAMLALLAVLLLLIQQGNGWQLFREPIASSFPKMGWNAAAFFKGLLFIVLSLTWITCAGFGIKYDIFGIGEHPQLIGLLLIVPFGTLFIVGLIFAAKGVFSRN